MTALRQPDVAKTAPKNRPAGISLARKAAFNILLAVERGHSLSDDLLRGKAVRALSPADRNLATALVLGVLRWQIRLDHQLQSLLKHPNAKLESEIRIALRLGAFQILHMDRIPARAAIDESVELAKQAGHRFASGMVNAVLRKLAGGALTLKSKKCQGTTSVVPHVRSESVGALATEGAISESAAELALVEAHPAWMVERWIGFYGFDAARAICAHGQAQPVHNLRLVISQAESELAQAGVVLEPGQLLTLARVVVSGDAATTLAFQEGRVRMQDEGSQLVAEIAAVNLNPGDGKILDACAAPGGKTLIMAERNAQAHILACESSPSRLEQMRQRLAAHAGRIEFRLADATKLAEDAAFDLVLADVPCSGTGTLGRNPEIRHRLRPEDLSRQAERQRAILAAALRAVRPGGRVVYSTCSLEPEENEQVVAAVLAATPGVSAIPLDASIEALRSESILTPAGAALLRASLTAEGALHLIPGALHTDGFFIALIERNLCLPRADQWAPSRKADLFRACRGCTPSGALHHRWQRTAREGGGLTYHQPGGNGPLRFGGLGVVLLDAGAESLYGGRSQVHARHLHGGQRRQHELRQMNVVEANHGNILRNVVRGAIERMQRADGGHVVGAQHSGWQVRQGDQPFHRSNAALHSVIALDDVFHGDGQPQFGHRLEKRVAS